VLSKFLEKFLELNVTLGYRKETLRAHGGCFTIERPERDIMSDPKNQAPGQGAFPALLAESMMQRTAIGTAQVT
jgi:hypothetical protein